MIETVEGTLTTAHYVFHLGEEGIEPEHAFSDAGNGLIDVQPGVATILSAVHTGRVKVSVQFHDRPPPVDTTDWEETVEVSLHASRGEVRLWGAESDEEELGRFPPLTREPGWYRLRVHARGRDLEDTPEDQDPGYDPADDWDLEEELQDPEINEHYLIMVWPASQAPTIVHKQTDKYGARFRA